MRRRGTEQFAVTLPPDARAMRAHAIGELFARCSRITEFARFTTKHRVGGGAGEDRRDRRASMPAIRRRRSSRPSRAITARRSSRSARRQAARADRRRARLLAGARRRARVEVATATAVTQLRSRARQSANRSTCRCSAQLLARAAIAGSCARTPTTAALLDRHGVRAYVPLGESSAVLGDDHVLTGTSLVRAAAAVDAACCARAPAPRPVMVAAELRDLPQPVDAGARERTPSSRSERRCRGDRDRRRASSTRRPTAGVAQLDLATLRGGGTRAIAARCRSRATRGHRRRTRPPTSIVALSRPMARSAGSVPRHRRCARAAGDVVLVRGDAHRRSTRRRALLARSRATTAPRCARPSLALDDDARWSSATSAAASSRALPSVRMLPVWSVEVAGVVASLATCGRRRARRARRRRRVSHRCAHRRCGRGRGLGLVVARGRRRGHRRGARRADSPA